MINFKMARVARVVESHQDISFLEVDIGGKLFKAINYNYLTGEIKVEDSVKVNTTAIDLGLGTGGYHFVMDNLSVKSNTAKGKGHIMKLRYTPMQVKCNTIEEDEEYKDVFNKFSSLGNVPVIVGGLHSIVAPIAAIIKHKHPGINIGYIMTDGGALPISLSNSIREMKKKGILGCSITCGHAFGGDYEAVNIYSALIIAKEVANCDVVITAMGPGIVGTGTKYGFSGIEQGYILDAVNTLGGRAIAVPRISFSDKRDRHRGISHHSITVLKEICKTEVTMAIPQLDKGNMDILKKQLREEGLDLRHKVIIFPAVEAEYLASVFEQYDIQAQTMGRGVKEDPEYFMALAACADLI